MIINGTKGRSVKVHYKGQRGVGEYDIAFEGLIHNMEKRYRKLTQTVQSSSMRNSCA